MNLFTTMKSPINRVGIIDPDGILNGSIINERIIKTLGTPGKKTLRTRLNAGKIGFFG